jgi:hypothetical protein
MKKSAVYLYLGIVLISFLFISLNINLTKAQNDAIPIDALPKGITPEKIENFTKTIDNLSQADYRYDYLSARLKKIILNITFFKQLDILLTNLNPILKYIFGTKYSFSLTFLLVVVLWTITVFFLSKIFNDLFTHNEGVSILLSLLFAISMANAYFFKVISESLMKLVSNKSGWVSMF